MIVCGDSANWAVCMLQNKPFGGQPSEGVENYVFEINTWAVKMSAPFNSEHRQLLRVKQNYITASVMWEKKTSTPFKKRSSQEIRQKGTVEGEAKVNLCQILWIFQFMCPAWSNTWVVTEETKYKIAHSSRNIFSEFQTTSEYLFPILFLNKTPRGKGIEGWMDSWMNVFPLMRAVLIFCVCFILQGKDHTSQITQVVQIKGK